MPDWRTMQACQQARNSVDTGTDLSATEVAELLDYINELSELYTKLYTQSKSRIGELLSAQAEDRVAIEVLQRQKEWAETAFYAAAQELMKGNTNV